MDRPIKNFNKYVRPIGIAKDLEDYLPSKIGIALGYGNGPWGYSPSALWGYPPKLAQPLADQEADESDPISVQYCNKFMGASQDAKDQRICVGSYGNGRGA